MHDRSGLKYAGYRALLGAAVFSLVVGGAHTGQFLIPSAAHAAEDVAGGAAGNCSGDPGGYGEMLAGYESAGYGQYATNPNSTATGLYQLTVAALQDAGYITSVSGKTPNGEDDWSNVVWSGKDGIYSRAAYMADTQAQANSLAAYTAKNLSYISGSYTAGQNVNGIPMTDGGAAAAVHMLGSGGFRQWAASGFSPSGLSSSIAAAHGWSQEEYQEHLMQRVASGGCFDPGNITPAASVSQDGTPVQDLPEIFLMPWAAPFPSTVIFPGSI